MSGNTVTITLVPQVLTAVGAVLLAVTLVQGTQELSTFSVVVTVHRNTSATVDASGNYISVEGLVPAPESAAQGQYLEVAAVDENGKITQMRAVDLSTAIGGKDGRGISSIERTNGNGAPGRSSEHICVIFPFSSTAATSKYCPWAADSGAGTNPSTLM